MMEAALVRAARLWRAVAGESTGLERFLKRRYRTAVRVERGANATQYLNNNAALVVSKKEPENKRGIYMKGGCDLPSLFLAAPMIMDSITDGSIAMSRPPISVGSSHTSQILQTLDGISRETVEETCRRLQIKPSFFQPGVFDPTFIPDSMNEFGAFPKNVVVLSIGSDLTRSLHRHREHGFLVDIGGWWLNQSLEKAIDDVDTIRWFKQTFEPVGRVSIPDFQSNMRRIARHLRDELSAELIVFNTLVVEPGKHVHNFQLLTEEHETRKREFNIALAELSGQLGFHVLDIDQVLKRQGVLEQVDFAHFPVEGKMPVAREGFRILKELEVF